MKPILEVQQIGKKFSIRHKAGRYLSFRERLVNLISFETEEIEDFWALDNISFDVEPGESIGIIGRNGAGKSTLLKILSRITPPTKGKIVCRGRIASLLEVGTGFHQELTGTENIFLNGSILGMKRKEIESKFDEIVDFSGVEKFLDTPLKHYSSGMQLRLAFAVAAFLEPEILVIDEVLAVGDSEFQKKCLGKMEDVSKSGRTILFVSHNIQAVLNLCKKAMLLQKGKMLQFGDAGDVATSYEGLLKKIAPVYSREESSSGLFFNEVRIVGPDGRDQSTFRYQDDIGIDLKILSRINSNTVRITVGVINIYGVKVFFTEKDWKFSPEEYGFRITIPNGFLAPGRFSLFLELHVPNTMAYDHQEQECQFIIEETGSPYSIYNGKWDCGVTVVNCNWTRL